jgi:large subunit ribosomal protein L16
MESAWLASNVIEAGRRGITHHLKKGGRMWIRIFPDKPVTARPAGQRMGSGKGDIDRYVAVIKPGTIIYEVTGIDVTLAKIAFAKAAAKLPFKTKFITKGD